MLVYEESLIDICNKKNCFDRYLPLIQSRIILNRYFVRNLSSKLCDVESQFVSYSTSWLYILGIVVRTLHKVTFDCIFKRMFRNFFLLLPTLSISASVSFCGILSYILARMNKESKWYKKDKDRVKILKLAPSLECRKSNIERIEIRKELIISAIFRVTISL